MNATRWMVLGALAALAACSSFAESDPPATVVAIPSPEGGLADAATTPEASAVVDAADAGRTWRYVFFTSDTQDGQMGPGSGSGRDRADTWCRTRADAGDARLKGLKWVAWLSTTTENARARIGAADQVLKVEYRLLSNELVLSPGFKLADGKGLLTAIHVDEYGATDANGITVWTGTEGSGKVAGDHCSNWSISDDAMSGLFGLAEDRDGWTNSNSTTKCGAQHHIYCFEVP